MNKATVITPKLPLKVGENGWVVEEADGRVLADFSHSTPDCLSFVVLACNNFQKMRDALTAFVDGEGDSWVFDNATTLLKHIEETESRLLSDCESALALYGN